MCALKVTRIWSDAAPPPPNREADHSRRGPGFFCKPQEGGPSDTHPRRVGDTTGGDHGGSTKIGLKNCKTQKSTDKPPGWIQGWGEMGGSPPLSAHERSLISVSKPCRLPSEIFSGSRIEDSEGGVVRPSSSPPPCCDGFWGFCALAPLLSKKDPQRPTLSSLKLGRLLIVRRDPDS